MTSEHVEEERQAMQQELLEDAVPQRKSQRLSNTDRQNMVRLLLSGASAAAVAKVYNVVENYAATFKLAATTAKEVLEEDAE